MVRATAKWNLDGWITFVREHSGKLSFKKFIGNFYFRLRNHLKVLLWRVCLRAKCDIQDRRFRISSATLLRQVRLCFVGTGREILNSNPAERLDEHPFILGLHAVRINGVPFSLVPSERRVANHVLVFSIWAFSKLRVVFLCKVFFLHYTPFIWRFYVTFLYIFLVCFHVN